MNFGEYSVVLKYEKNLTVYDIGKNNFFESIKHACMNILLIIQNKGMHTQRNLIKSN